MGRGRISRPGGTRLAAAVAALAALSVGCSAGDQPMSAGRQTAESVEAPRSARDTDGVPAVDDGGSGALGQANRPTVQTHAVIRKCEISVVTKEMNRARMEVEDLLTRLGGYIAREDTTNDRAGRPEWSVLVLRVPEPAFDDAVDELADIGRTERTDRSSEDVTTEVIDVDTRVATQEASLERLRKFLDRATDVADMVRVESEIARRQAELESLKAQQEYLHDQTAMSTITVRLRIPAAPSPSRLHDTGFLAGLEDGWQALKTVLVAAATVAGVLLPFLATLALVGVPVWLLLRGLWRRRRATAPPPPAAEAG